MLRGWEYPRRRGLYREEEWMGKRLDRWGGYIVGGGVKCGGHMGGGGSVGGLPSEEGLVE